MHRQPRHGGRTHEDHLKLTDDAGEALGTGIERAGGSVALLAQAKRSDIAAAFELHIEQGPFLEAERIDIGVVTAIAGILRLEVLFTGAADRGHHAFHASPGRIFGGGLYHPGRPRRSRTLRGFGARLFRCHDRHRGRGTERRERRAPHGRIVVDARFVDSTLAARFTAALDEATAQAAATARVDRRFSILSDSPPSHCDAGLRDILSSAATDLGLSPRPMTSGAGHDTAFLTRIAPAAMVFVPCREGAATRRRNGRSRRPSQRAPPFSWRRSSPSTAAPLRVPKGPIPKGPPEMGRYLGPRDLEAALRGGSVFACGGGGFLDHGRMLGTAAVNAGRPELVSMDEVDDAAFIATAAAIGAPGASRNGRCAASTT